MATWSPRTFSFEQILAAAHLNEIRDFLNRVAPAKVTAVGDLVVGSEAHNVSRLAVGSDNQVLVADSSESLGMRWGTVGGRVPDRQRYLCVYDCKQHSDRYGVRNRRVRYSWFCRFVFR